MHCSMTVYRFGLSRFLCVRACVCVILCMSFFSVAIEMFSMNKVDYKKFGEKIPTSPISPEVIDVHTLNFKPNFKFSRLKIFWGDPRPNWGVR